jgi:hypothetical protein
MATREILKLILTFPAVIRWISGFQLQQDLDVELRSLNDGPYALSSTVIVWMINWSVCEEVVVATFKGPRISWRDWERPRKPAVRLHGFRAEIRTQDLTYHFTVPLRSIQKSLTNAVWVPMWVINTRVTSPGKSKLPFLQWSTVVFLLKFNDWLLTRNSLLSSGYKFNNQFVYSFHLKALLIRCWEHHSCRCCRHAVPSVTSKQHNSFIRSSLISVQFFSLLSFF